MKYGEEMLELLFKTKINSDRLTDEREYLVWSFKILRAAFLINCP